MTAVWDLFAINAILCSPLCLQDNMCTQQIELENMTLNIRETDVTLKKNRETRIMVDDFQHRPLKTDKMVLRKSAKI